MKALVAAIAVSGLCHFAHAAPDEDELGRGQGCPVGTAKTWFFDESVRVGSFTAQGEVGGIAGGRANVLEPSDAPMPLASAEREPPIRWSIGDLKSLTVDDYLSRQRIMGLLIVKDGVIQVERYQYGRQPSQRFLSNSSAKTGLELAGGNFNATLRDYARLGIVLATNGVRPDGGRRQQIIARDYLLEATARSGKTSLAREADAFWRGVVRQYGRW